MAISKILTEEDRKKSYAKYFDRPLTPIPEDKLAILKNGPIDPSLALPIDDRNKLFEPGYMPCEIGYCPLPDGTAYLANLTAMPEVTSEMFEWWFAWHPLDDLRYRIWDPDDHVYARTLNPERNLDQTLPMRERTWGVRHHVLEDIGAGEDELIIEFERPSVLGYDESRVGTKHCSAMMAANGHSPNPGPGAMAAVMTHFVRELDRSIELRTRFWIGNQIVNGKAVSVLPPGVRIPAEAAFGLFAHNLKEFTNLSTLLPLLYTEEKDNW
jgi:hypothetical protein